MLDLQDFFHLPEIDTFFDQLAADGPGLALVGGLDPQIAPADADSFPPSVCASLASSKAKLIPLFQSLAALSAPELCAAAFDHVKAYEGEAEQYDDMTMLVIQVKE